MLFYPIEFVGVDVYRSNDSPWGFFGWQGVVPTKTRQMSERLVGIITSKLLSLTEAFGRLDSKALGGLLTAPVSHAIERDVPYGHTWALLLNPFLPWALARCVRALQREVDDVFDLEAVVRSAFMRDKRVL